MARFLGDLVLAFRVSLRRRWCGLLVETSLPDRHQAPHQARTGCAPEQHSLCV